MSACLATLRICVPVLLCGGLTLARAAPPLTLYAEDYPPFSWTDKASGKAVGVSADIGNELGARAMLLTTSTANSCVYATARVPEREALYQWIGPIGRNEWVMFARSADHLVLHTLDDARPYQIGTFIGDASVAYLNEHRLQVHTTPSDRLNPPKLEKRRIGLWSVGRLPGLYLLREMGISDVEPVLSFTSADMYLASTVTSIRRRWRA